MKIGIFDSGLGGLSIFKQILKKLPEYDYIYLGDNARVPYGNRSANLIYQFTKNAVDFLFKQDCQLIIIACNTATSNALRKLQQQYLPKHYPNRRILGVIRPVIETAVSKNFQRLGIMATTATVSSNSFPTELHKLNPRISVFQQPCPLLVPIIEEGETDWPGLDLLIQQYLQPLLDNNIDSLILGCTHYALIEKTLKKHLPPNIKIISQGQATAEKLHSYLLRHPEIEKKLSKNSSRIYYSTDLNQNYKQLTKLFLEEYYNNQTELISVNI